MTRRGLRQAVVLVRWWLLLTIVVLPHCQGSEVALGNSHGHQKKNQQRHNNLRHLQGFGQPPPAFSQLDLPDDLLELKFNFGFYDGTGLRRASDVEVVMLLGRIRAYMMDVLDFPSRHGDDDDDDLFGFFNLANINWNYNKAQNGEGPTFDLSFNVYSCSRGGDIMKNTNEVGQSMSLYFDHLSMVGKYVHDYTDYTFYDVGEVAYLTGVTTIEADDSDLVLDCSVSDNYGMPVPYLRMTFGYFEGFARQPTAEEVLLLFKQTEKYINDDLALHQEAIGQAEEQNAHHEATSSARQSGKLLSERPTYYLDHVKLVDTRWSYNPFSSDPLMIRFNLYNCARDGTPYATPRHMIKSYRDHFNLTQYFSEYLHLAEYRNYSIFDLNTLNRNAGVAATDPTLLECEVSPTTSPYPTMAPPTDAPTEAPTTAPVDETNRGTDLPVFTSAPTNAKIVVTRPPEPVVEEEVTSGGGAAFASQSGILITVLAMLLSVMWVL